jgi:broad specificity phosphatase PhoE
MTQLVLVRHGEAAAGEDADDPELSDRGRRQVAALAGRHSAVRLSRLSAAARVDALHKPPSCCAWSTARAAQHPH